MGSCMEINCSPFTGSQWANSCAFLFLGTCARPQTSLMMVVPFFFTFLSHFMRNVPSYDGPFKGTPQTFEFQTRKTIVIPAVSSHFHLRKLQACHLKTSLAALVDTEFVICFNKMLRIHDRLLQKYSWISNWHEHWNWCFKQSLSFL